MRRNVKKIYILLLFSILLFLMTGCSSNQNTTNIDEEGIYEQSINSNISENLFL